MTDAALDQLHQAMTAMTATMAEVQASMGTLADRLSRVDDALMALLQRIPDSQGPPDGVEGVEPGASALYLEGALPGGGREALVAVTTDMGKAAKEWEAAYGSPWGSAAGRRILRGTYGELQQRIMDFRVEHPGTAPLRPPEA